VFLFIAGAVLLGLTLRGHDQGPFIVWYAFLIGASDRFSRIPLLNGSDVLRATQEALVNLLHGLNPYTVPLTSTIPPGSPLVSPPGELFWYLPAHLFFGDITRVDTVAGILTTAAIGIVGLRAGWDRVALPAMLYATWGIGAFRAVDGSNDVSAAFMVVLALAILVFADRDTRFGKVAFVVSAIAFGWAVAFKQFAVVILPLVLRHLAVAGRDWRRYGAISLATIAIFVVPFLLWAPGAFLSQQLATLTFHTDVWGANLLALLQEYTDVDRLVGVLLRRGDPRHARHPRAVHSRASRNAGHRHIRGLCRDPERPAARTVDDAAVLRVPRWRRGDGPRTRRS